MTPGTGRLSPERVRRLELLALLALLVLAALTRLPGLADRGRWDADQGTDLRVLAALASDGEVPLLGPRTSIGTFHHGAVYYYLLAPAAVVSSADPVAVTGAIALFGIAAVAGTWWLARLVGGPLAAVAAGLLAAISPAGIDESTFIWNPNLIPAAAALAYAAALRARATGRARWWVASGVGAMVTMQCHVLGVVIVLPLLGAWVADLVGRRRAGVPAGGVVRGGLGAAAVMAAGYLPLLAWELGNGFSETRAILAYVAGDVGGAATALGAVERVVLVGLRSVTWPIAGLITDRIAASLVALMVVALLAAVAVLGTRRRGSGPARWLLATLAVSVVALALFAPSLAVIVPELPNDHYHAFLDPVVLALVGAGLARLATAMPGGLPGRAAAGALAAVMAVIAVGAWPPAQAPDGGWPLADTAAGRLLATTGDGPIALDGIPSFKNDNALRFPLERRGAPVLPPAGEDPPTPGAGSVVLVCDPLFDEVTGAPCGGRAEDGWMAEAGLGGLALVDRFESGPRRVISVYAADAP